MAKKTPQRIVQRNQKCSEGNAKIHVCWVPVVWFWLFAKRHADFPNETKKMPKMPTSNLTLTEYTVLLHKDLYGFFWRKKKVI